MTNTTLQTLLITGGTGGLGPTVVRTLVEQYTCVVLYRSADTWQALQQEGGSNSNLQGIQTELLDQEAVRRAVEQTHARWGIPYGLVHLAGGFETGSVADTTLDTWNGQLATNLTSAFMVIRAVLPGLRERGTGRIITIGSSAVLTRPASMAAYNVAKAGLQVLTETLARELKNTRITANILLPGSLDTPAMRGQTSRKKLVPLQRVAATVAFLLSDAAASITGASIPLTVTGASDDA